MSAISYQSESLPGGPEQTSGAAVSAEDVAAILAELRRLSAELRWLEERTQALHSQRVESLAEHVRSMDANLVAGVAQLTEGFGRLDSDLVTGLARQTQAATESAQAAQALAGATHEWRDALLRQMQSADANLIAGLQRLSEGLERLEARLAAPVPPRDPALVAMDAKMDQLAEALTRLEQGVALLRAPSSQPEVGATDAAQAQIARHDQTIEALQRLDLSLIKGMSDLVWGFGRLDQALVGFGEQISAANTARVTQHDDTLRGLQAIDANLVKGLECIAETLGRLDKDVAAGVAAEIETLWQVKAALSAELEALQTAGPPRSAPAAAVAQGLDALIGAPPREMRRVRVPHPFSNMTRTAWVEAVTLWREHAPKLLARRKARPCPACGESKPHGLFQSYDGYPFAECGACGAWYVPLRINQELFARYFEMCPQARALADYMLAQDDVASVAEADRARFTGYYEELRALAARDGARSLDIGCGIGASLDVAAGFGFEAHGVEVNDAARARAVARGRTLFARLADVPAGAFDVITLWESLEHIDDTDAVMAFVAERLAPEGVFAASVPNLDSPIIRSLREDSFHINGGSGFAGHINLFTQRSLGELCARFGLELVRARGQFSMNLNELIGYHIGAWRGARDYLQKEEIAFDLPAAAVELASAIGPSVARWEETHAMAPILHVIARRAR